MKMGRDGSGIRNVQWAVKDTITLTLVLHLMRMGLRSVRQTCDHQQLTDTSLSIILCTHLLTQDKEVVLLEGGEEAEVTEALLQAGPGRTEVVAKPVEEVGEELVIRVVEKGQGEEVEEVQEVEGDEEPSMQ